MKLAWRSLVMATVVAAATTAYAADFSSAWTDLASNNAERAAQAQADLIAAGEKAATYVTAQLAADVDADRIAKVVNDLEHESFKVREEASRQLLAMGKNAQPILEKLLRESKNPEVTTRLEAAITKLANQRRPDPAELARQNAGIAILETFGEKQPDRSITMLEQVRVRTPWDSTRASASGAIDRIRGKAFESAIKALQADAIAGKDVQQGVADLRTKLAAAKLSDDEAINFQLSRIDVIIATHAKVKELREKLAAKDDVRMRLELARLLIGVLDDPAGASALVDEKVGIGRTFALAAKNRADLTSAERLQLAQFYVTQARAGGGIRPELLYGKAIDLLKECAKDKDLSEQQRQSAATMLSDVEQNLADVSAIAAGWTTLSTLADTTKHVGAGEWTKSGAALTVKSGDFALINLPAAPEGSYELRVKLTRTQGSDGIFIAVPVGGSRGCLNIGGWGNSISTLESVAGHSGDNFTNEALGRQAGIDNGKAYEYVIRVTQLPEDKVRVDVTENGKKFASYDGPANGFGTNAIWRMADRLNFAIGAHRSDVVFQHVRVKPLEGGKINRLNELTADSPAPAPAEAEN